MSGKTPAASELTRYLLGVVSRGERERLEREYFSDDEAFGQMLSAEDDLIDEYARGQLSAIEQHHFEEQFLHSTLARERVQFARTLAEFIADTRSSERPSPYQPGFILSLRLPRMGLRFAVVVTVLALATVWLLVQQGRTRNELQPQLALKAEPENRSGETKQQVPSGGSKSANADPSYATSRRTKIKPKQTADSIKGNTIDRKTVAQSFAPAIFDLTPGTLRSEGGKTNTFTVGADAKSIVFRLGLEDAGHEYYRASIETIDGSPVRSFDRFKSKSPTRDDQGVQLPPIPASELPVGVYVIELHAQQRDGSFLKVADYSFTILRTE